MSLKDKGNELFRTGKFEDAIKCYELYIQQDPKPDKKVAYTNISFCHYKMKQYKESLEAADSAIQEDQTYAKAYFRKMHAYKQMGNNDYGVYINGLLLLKYQSDADEKIKIDTQSIVKQYKQKWINKINNHTFQISADQFIFELTVQNKPIVQQPQQLTPDEWILKWSQKGVSLQSHWQKVEEQIVKNNRFGFNLAFLFLNQLKQPQHKLIYQKIKDMQNTLARKMDIESEDENQNQKIEKEDEKQVKSESHQSSSSDQNLFASPQLNDEPSINGKKPQILKDVCIERKIAKQHQLINIKQEELSIQMKPIKKQEALKISNQALELLYEKFIIRLNNARDVMVQLLKMVQEILSSGLQEQKKRQLINFIREKRQKEIKLMKTSCSKSQQQKVRDLLISNGMEEYMPDFANRHVSNK